MPLESANFIADLDPANPLPQDGKDKGDDHIRTTKKAAKQSFVGFPGAILAGGVDVGTTNAYVLSPPTPLPTYSVNLTVLWLPTSTNGGASTINISGLGAQPIRRVDGTALANGDIMAGQPVAMFYTGSEFRLLAVTPQAINQLVFSGALPNQTNNSGKVMGTLDGTAGWTNAFGVAMDEAEGAAIPATATLNLTSGPGTGNFVHITGTASISAMTLPAGASRDLVFDGSPTLVHGANLILPGSANIAVQPGDTLRVRGEGAGVVRVVDYVRATGRALVEPTPAGLVLLATITPVAGVTALDALNVFSATYDDYLVIANDLSNSNTNTSGNAGYISLLVAKNGVVDSAMGSYLASAIGSAGGGGNSNAIYFGMDIPAGGPSLTFGFAELRFSNVNDADATAFHGIEARCISGRTFNPNTAVAAAVHGVHSNAFSGTGAVSGFRLTMTNSTFGATGSLKIYGIRKV